MQKPDYKQVFAISQSALKAFRTKPIQKFKKIYIDKEEDDDDQSKFAFGSLVDTLAFTPKLLEKRFYIADRDIAIPGDKVKQIADKVFQEASAMNNNIIELNKSGNLPEPISELDMSYIKSFASIILKAAREIKFGGTTWSDSRILTTVYEDASDYFYMLGLCRGRQLMTLKDNSDAVDTVDILKKDEGTKAYFVKQTGESLIFQQEIFIDYILDDLIIPLKAALDILRISHKNKTLQIADLKTTYSSDEFKKTAKNFDYLTQASFYDFILRQFKETYLGGKYKHYSIKEPINIVIDREYKIPYIFDYTYDDLDVSKNGNDDFTGWMSTLKDIGWHMKQGLWEKPRELYERGSIKLKFFR